MKGGVRNKKSRYTYSGGSRYQHIVKTGPKEALRLAREKYFSLVGN